MSEENQEQSKLDTEIDAGQFFTNVILVIVGVGFLIGVITYTLKVYNPKEKAVAHKTHYVYEVLGKEMVEMYQKKGYIFKEDDENDMEFCKLLVEKYAKNQLGSCMNMTENIQQNFVFKKGITIYGLEKPPEKLHGTYIKDIIIDTDTEEKGENLIGSDKVILRLYSSGRKAGTISPVNCSTQDQKDYGINRSALCPEFVQQNFTYERKPVGFSILYTNPETQESRLITRNTSFLEADCRSSDGEILAADDFCAVKLYSMFPRCEDEDACKIIVSK